MSFNIDWSVTSDLAIQSRLRCWIEQQLEEKVNASLRAKDGTEIHLLELHLGQQPPNIELASMGMEHSQGAATGEGASSVQQFAVPADQLLSESTILGASGGDRPRSPGTGSSGSGSGSGRGSPRWAGSSSSSPALSMQLQSPSPSPSLLSSSFTSLSASGSSSRIASAQRCSGCGGRLSSSASRSMPGFSLSGRVSYASDFSAVLQVKRQVNPYPSTRGLAGRLARSHLPTPITSMDWPLTVEIWVRLGQLRINAEAQVAYTPGSNNSSSGKAIAAPSQQASPMTSPSSSRAQQQQRQQQHSRSCTPAQPSYGSSRVPSSASASAATAGSSSLAPPPAAAFSFPSASASPALPSTPAPFGSSSSSSYFSTPALGFGFGSPSFGAIPPCQCASSAAAATAAAPGAAAAATPSSASSPATLTLLLDSNPLQGEGFVLSSALDNSPAGRKIQRMAQTGVEQGLAQLVGQKFSMELPEMNLGQIIKLAKEKNKQQKQQQAEQRKQKHAATQPQQQPPAAGRSV